MEAAELQGPLEIAVEHITANAQHYFDVVKSHGRRGLLWLVFLLPTNGPHEGQALYRSEAISVKSISFLPLEAVQSSQSDSLMRMYQTYDEVKQFVCWYTLESTDGTPLYSKVVVVDSTDPSGATAHISVEREQTTNALVVTEAGDSPAGKGQDYTSLLKMTIEIADAAGKMSTAIDDLNSKVVKLTERLDLTDRGLKAMLQDDRSAALEAKVSMLEGMVVKLMNAQNPHVHNMQRAHTETPSFGDSREARNPVWNEARTDESQPVQSRPEVRHSGVLQRSVPLRTSPSRLPLTPPSPAQDVDLAKSAFADTSSRTESKLSEHPVWVYLFT